jgi:secreted PhoX family phosphatase
MNRTFCTLSVLALSAVTSIALADREEDSKVFGFSGSVANSGLSIGAPAANADATALITLAKGLRARTVASSIDAGANIDQIALWPDAARPTHLIVMNEQGAAQPGVQRIRLSDGLVETILSGTSSGDAIRVTPWGTILAGEENGADGQMLEIIDPLNVTGVFFDRASGVVTGGTGSEKVVARRGLGRLSFEGLAILPNGVVYYGDESRPSAGAAGGAYFKFIPSQPRVGGTPIANLSESPLAAGKIYGLKLSRGSNNGQGNNTGLGVWVEVPSTSIGNLRAAAATLKLSGYYRPEDIDIDLKALSAGKVRVCGANTGNETDHNYGEIICIDDGALAQSTTNVANPEVQFLALGNAEFAMPDNVVYNAKKNFWVFHEDADGVSQGRNNDIWACAQDGSDFDTLSDGCSRFATLNDLTAETTGGIFDASGKHFYVSVQHNVTGHGVILDITGWNADD